MAGKYLLVEEPTGKKVFHILPITAAVNSYIDRYGIDKGQVVDAGFYQLTVSADYTISVATYGELIGYKSSALSAEDLLKLQSIFKEGI